MIEQLNPWPISTYVSLMNRKVFMYVLPIQHAAPMPCMQYVVSLMNTCLHGHFFVLPRYSSTYYFKYIYTETALPL